MNNVFTLTVIPATRYSKEWLIVSVAPGVPGEMIAKNAGALDAIAQKRNAHLTLVKDVTVKVEPQSWWQRWRARKTIERIRREHGK